MKEINIGDRVIGTDFNGDTYEGTICKIKNQELGWDEQGFELDKLKFFIEGVHDVRFNYEDLKLIK